MVKRCFPCFRRLKAIMVPLAGCLLRTNVVATLAAAYVLRNFLIFGVSYQVFSTINNQLSNI